MIIALLIVGVLLLASVLLIAAKGIMKEKRDGQAAALVVRGVSPAEKHPQRDARTTGRGDN